MLKNRGKHKKDRNETISERCIKDHESDLGGDLGLSEANELMKKGLSIAKKYPDAAYKLLATAGRVFASQYYNRDAFRCYTSVARIQSEMIERQLSAKGIGGCRCLSFLDLLVGPVHDGLNGPEVFANQKNLTHVTENFVGSVLVLFKSSLYAARIARNHSKELSKKIFLHALSCVFPPSLLELLSDAFGSSGLLSIDSPYLPGICSLANDARVGLHSLSDVTVFYCTMLLDMLQKIFFFVEQKCQNAAFNWGFFSLFLEEVSGFLSEDGIDRTSLVLYELAARLNMSLLQRNDVAVTNLERLSKLYNRLGIRNMELDTFERILKVTQCPTKKLQFARKSLSLAIILDDQERIRCILRIVDQIKDDIGPDEEIQRIILVAQANARFDDELLDKLEWESLSPKILNLCKIVRNRIYSVSD